jgi:hypothetical protein
MSILRNGMNWIELGRKPEISVNALGMSTLLRNVLENDSGHISECYIYGNVDSDNLESIKAKMTALGGRLVYNFIGKPESLVWIWKDGMAEYGLSGSYVTVAAASKDQKLVETIRDFVAPLIVPEKKKGHVFAITKQYGNLSLSSLGNASIRLVRDNYSDEVIKDYDFVIKDLNSNQPSGRIVIMEGEPGTGKTHLVRAMLLEVPDAMFVLVPPEMVSSLGGPELLPLLIDNRHHASGPIILVLEDADKVLVTRGNENINSIQSLLNLGDGILGSMLDLRIIATTNAQKLEMEAAIMRPGRLSKDIKVGALSASKSQFIFNKLVPGLANVADTIFSIEEDKPFTLAEIYSVAREHGWNPESRKHEVVVHEKPDAYDAQDEEDSEY